MNRREIIVGIAALGAVGGLTSLQSKPAGNSNATAFRDLAAAVDETNIADPSAIRELRLTVNTTLEESRSEKGSSKRSTEIESVRSYYEIWAKFLSQAVAARNELLLLEFALVAPPDGRYRDANPVPPLAAMDDSISDLSRHTPEPDTNTTTSEDALYPDTKSAVEGTRQLHDTLQQYHTAIRSFIDCRVSIERGTLYRERGAIRRAREEFEIAVRPSSSIGENLRRYALSDHSLLLAEYAELLNDIERAAELMRDSCSDSPAHEKSSMELFNSGLDHLFECRSRIAAATRF